MVKIVDNFLDSYNFNILKKTFLYNEGGMDFPLHLKIGVSNKDANDGIYFTHCLKHDDFFNGKAVPHSPFLDLLQPVIFKLSAQKIYRIQFNLYPKTFFKVHHAFHRDHEESHKGCILSLNTNNGQTIIKNNPFNIGVKSIANRALFFDPSIPHKSTTCSNKDFRANIIFNYV